MSIFPNHTLKLKSNTDKYKNWDCDIFVDKFLENRLFHPTFHIRKENDILPAQLRDMMLRGNKRATFQTEKFKFHLYG